MNMKEDNKSGFTLIELVLVVAVLAIIAVIAIGKFSDLRKSAARKTNVSSLANIDRTIRTDLYDCDKFAGKFDYLESLIDSAEGGGDCAGSAGTYQWSAAWYDGNGGVVPGIYCGIKKTGVVKNKSGQTSGVVADIGTAHQDNVGLGDFANKLGIYFLSEKEVTSLSDAGIRIVLRHNYSNMQAAQAIPYKGSDTSLHTCGGGPGMRPDLSAYYPAVLTNGSAVAVLDPAQCASVYRDLGLDYDTALAADCSASNPDEYFTKGVCKRLLVFGMGRESNVTTALFTNPPRCSTLDKTHYRNYLLVFQMNNGSGNSGTTVTFVGVIDPAGNTYKQALYNADYAS